MPTTIAKPRRKKAKRAIQAGGALDRAYIAATLRAYRKARAELARILFTLASHLMEGQVTLEHGRMLLDINGNMVGIFEVEP